MATPFMLVSTFKVKEGSLEKLRDYSRRVAELMQAKEPRVIAFHCFLSEDGTEMSTIQLHPDVASMELQVQRDNWEETFSQVVTMLEGIRVDYYGAKPPESAWSRSGEPAVRSASSPPTLPASHARGRRRRTEV